MQVRERGWGVPLEREMVLNVKEGDFMAVVCSRKRSRHGAFWTVVDISRADVSWFARLLRRACVLSWARFGFRNPIDMMDGGLISSAA